GRLQGNVRAHPLVRDGGGDDPHAVGLAATGGIQRGGGGERAAQRELRGARGRGIGVRSSTGRRHLLVTATHATSGSEHDKREGQRTEHETQRKQGSRRGAS